VLAEIPLDGLRAFFGELPVVAVAPDTVGVAVNRQRSHAIDLAKDTKRRVIRFTGDAGPDKINYCKNRISCQYCRRSADDALFSSNADEAPTYSIQQKGIRID
jgi:phosphoribosylanthranilate isomerase